MHFSVFICRSQGCAKCVQQRSTKSGQQEACTLPAYLRRTLEFLLNNSERKAPCIWCDTKKAACVYHQYLVENSCLQKLKINSYCYIQNLAWKCTTDTTTSRQACSGVPVDNCLWPWRSLRSWTFKVCNKLVSWEIEVNVQFEPWYTTEKVTPTGHEDKSIGAKTPSLSTSNLQQHVSIVFLFLHHSVRYCCQKQI